MLIFPKKLSKVRGFVLYLAAVRLRDVAVGEGGGAEKKTCPANDMCASIYSVNLPLLGISDGLGVTK